MGSWQVIRAPPGTGEIMTPILVWLAMAWALKIQLAGSPAAAPGESKAAQMVRRCGLETAAISMLVGVPCSLMRPRVAARS
jgi:hypothetical protein